jgi:ADP-heptose:LPS heptosyltransferase
VILRAARRAGREATYWAFRLWCASLGSPPFDAARVRKIMLPLYAGVGNVVLYLPAIRAIRDRFPDAEIVAVVGNARRNEEVVGALVDRFLEVPLEGSLSRRYEALRAIRAERFDLAVNAFHCVYPMHAAMTAAARPSWRCGHTTSPGWSNPYDFLYNLPAPMARDEYEVDRYLALARALGCESPSGALFFDVTEDARARAKDLLVERGLAPGAAFVAVHAGTSDVMRWKNWGLEKFTRAILRIADARPDLSFVLVGAPDERASQTALAAALAAALGPRFVDLIGTTDISTLAAVLERAALLVGNDSGPMQIAAALGRETVVPWGPSDLPRNAPRGDRHTILFKALPCSPCYRMPGDSHVHLCNDRQCLAQIDVDEVAGAAIARLDAARKAAPVVDRHSVAKE